MLLSGERDMAVCRTQKSLINPCTSRRRALTESAKTPPDQIFGWSLSFRLKRWLKNCTTLGIVPAIEILNSFRRGAGVRRFFHRNAASGTFGMFCRTAGRRRVLPLAGAEAAASLHVIFFRQWRQLAERAAQLAGLPQAGGCESRLAAARVLFWNR
jgi:hypothetical protein